MTRFVTCNYDVVTIEVDVWTVGNAFRLDEKPMAPSISMLTLATLVMAFTPALHADTTVVLGHVERDLTGDGKPEILRVVGVGPSIYDLAVTFTIESAGKTIYRNEMERMTRTVGFDAGRHVISEEQHLIRIKEFGQSFFSEKKFMRPQEYVEYLRAHARRHIADIPNLIDRQASDTVPGSVIWEGMLNSPITIFTFSPGGDGIEAIGWHAPAGRFYELLSCC